MNDAFQILFGGAARYGLPELIQRARPPLADFKSIFDELLDKWKDFRKDVRTDFGLLLKLLNVKTQDGVLYKSPAYGSVCPIRRALLFLLILLLAGQSVSIGQSSEQ